MPTIKNRLNDLSREQIEQFKQKAKEQTDGKQRNCLQCGKLALMRADQKFCSPKCRAAHHWTNREAYVLFLESEVTRLKDLLTTNGISHG
jgi:endogenous inhibitor of DNA gyrase (YacG/DUF329 family)